MSIKSTEPHAQEAQEYECLVCNAQFFHLPPQKLICPECGAQDPDTLVLQPAIEDTDEAST